MSDSAQSNTILSLDHHSFNDRFVVGLVTQSDLVSSRILDRHRKAILDGLDSGSDPIALLKSKAALGEAPKVVPLSSLDSVHSHEDDAELYFRYLNPTNNKLKKGFHTFSSEAARSEAIRAIERVVGDLESVQEPASIWHTGLTQIILSALAILFFVFVGIAGLIEGRNQADPGKVRKGAGELIALAFNTVGPVGMILIGLAIVAAMMFWWYLRCQNPPTKTILRPKRLH